MSLVARLWARRRERPALVGVAVVLLATLLVWPVFDWWLRASFAFPTKFQFNDFGAYAGAVDSWEHGETLYNRNDDGGFWGAFLYPPVAVLLFYPFVALFEFRMAAMAWVATSGLLLWVGLQALVAALGYSLRWWERLGLAWLIAGYHPALLAAKMGQTALFTGGMLSLAGAALVWSAHGSDADAGDGADGRASTEGASGADTGSRWALVSGAATAVVGIVKFAYAPIGAHLLHDRRRLLGALLVVPPLAWLSIRFFGIEAHRTYLEVLQWGVDKGKGDPRSPTLWLPPYFKPLSGFPMPQLIRYVASLGVVALAVLAPPRARNLVFALGVAMAPLFTPQTYAYYLVALLPAAVVLLHGELRRDGYPELVVVGLLFAHLHSYGLKFLVDDTGSAHVVAADLVPMWRDLLEPHYLLLQPGLWGGGVLFGLAAVRVAQTIEDPSAVPERVRDTAADRIARVRDTVTERVGPDGD